MSVSASTRVDPVALSDLDPGVTVFERERRGGRGYEHAVAERVARGRAGCVGPGAGAWCAADEAGAAARGGAGELALGGVI